MSLNSQCTRNQDNRRITRWDEDVLERIQRRVHQQPDKMRKRKQLVEHPFGTMKRWMEQGYFLMRRQEKVATEMSLTVLAYNLKRVLNLIGTRKMIAALA